MNTDKQLSYDLFQVTDAQMMVSRTPEVFFNWVEANSTELDGRPVSRRSASSNAKLSKKFYEEARPIAFYTLKKYGNRSDVLITLKLSNKNFDAIITEQGKGSVYIEVTYAKDGYDEALRMEVLLNQRVVSTHAPIKIIKKKGRRPEVCIPPMETVKHDHVARKNISLVEERLEKKAHKSYGNSHILLVAVEDFITSWAEHDVMLLDQAVQKKIKNLYLDFSKIIVQGTSGKLQLSYPLTSNL